MISAAEMTEAASMRAKSRPDPTTTNSAGTEITLPWSATRCSAAMRAGAIRPFSVICAEMPSTITTTNERRLPRPSSTSAREPQPFDSTMP